MALDHSTVTEMREDVSRFVVHLTRDDRGDFPGGQKARDNFLSILDAKEIRAYLPHCVHRQKILKLSDGRQENFKVACFTEVPLSQIRYLVGTIPGRQIELSSYGFVFNKKFLIEKGAQPALYINSYGPNTHLREAVDLVYDLAVKKKFSGRIWRLLPFVSAMHEKYDFTWEREWRVLGSLVFKLTDLVCVILPPVGNEDIRERLAKSGIAAISPKWTYERIVAELALQQRRTRLILKGLVPKHSGQKTGK
jgi:hypothetical protein